PLDGALDFDVEVIDAGGQARQESRGQNHTSGDRIGNFRHQIGVTTNQAVILSGRVRSDELSCRQTLRDTARVRRGEYFARARIGRAIKHNTLGSEEVLYRGGTHRAVVAAADTNVPGGSQFTFDLVGVGRIARAVVRIAVTAGN